jgi:hypothetical protein
MNKEKLAYFVIDKYATDVMLEFSEYLQPEDILKLKNKLATLEDILKSQQIEKLRDILRSL